MIEEWGYAINNSIVSSLNHIYDNTWGFSSFASLYFVIGLDTISVVILIKGLSNGGSSHRFEAFYMGIPH